MKLPVTFFILLLAGYAAQAQSPLNWTLDEINPGEDFTLAPDETSLSEGAMSCHMQLHSGAVPYLVSDVYYVTPGAAYEFSFDVLDNDTAGQVKVYADFYDAYGFDIFGEAPVFSSDSSGWQTISWEGTVPSQAVVGYVLIKFYCQPDLYNFTRTANIWIDNIRFRDAGGNNLVANGGFESWNVGVEDYRVKPGALTIYPNPAVDFVNIELPGEAKTLVISDLTGREIYRESLTGATNFRLNVRNYPNSIYQVQAILLDGSVLSKKFIKQ
jgi:hypothetical protein